MITLTDRLRKLVNPKVRGRGRLLAAVDKSPINGGRGVGTFQDSETATGTLSPPFVEQKNVREYYDEVSYTSSDGFFVIVTQNIESTEFLDGNGVLLPVSYVDE